MDQNQNEKNLRIIETIPINSVYGDNFQYISGTGKKIKINYDASSIEIKFLDEDQQTINFKTFVVMSISVFLKSKKIIDSSQKI